MSMKPSPAVDRDLDSWLKLFAITFVAMVIGTQFVAEQPGPMLFAVSLAFCLLPAGFVAAILLWCGKVLGVLTR